jgi:hypothetical protein
VANVAEGEDDDEELKRPVSGSIIDDVVVTVELKQLFVEDDVSLVVVDAVVIDGIVDVPLYVGNGWEGVDQVVVASCLHNAPVCHMDGKYGHEKLLPDNNISRMSVSIGVLPTSRTKNNCSITCL